MIFDALVIGHIRRNPLGTLLIIAAIAFGVASFVAANLTSTFATRAIVTSVLGASEGANLQIAGYGEPLNAGLLQRVREMPGVIEARPTIGGSVEIGSDRNHALTVQLVGIDVLQSFPGSRELRPYEPGPFAPPGALESALIERSGVLVPTTLASRLAVRAGSSIEARAGSVTKTLTVTAVLAPQTIGLDRNTILVDIATARDLLGTRDTFERIDVIASGDRLAEVSRRMQATLPPRTVVTYSAERIAKLERVTRGFELDLAILAYVALVVGAILVANAIAISVRQRRAEIGIFRSLGATRAQIAAAFLAEGTLLGTLGGIAGALVGDELARAISASGAPASLVETSTQLAGDTALLVRGIALGFVLSLLAALAPALEAASVLPTNAMRFVPQRTSRDAWFFAALGRTLLERSFVSAWLALERCATNGSRLRLTIGAMVIAICASIGVATATASFGPTLAHWSDETTPGDLEVFPASAGRAPLPAALLRRLGHLPGVVRVSGVSGAAAGAIAVYAVPAFPLDRLRVAILSAAAPTPIDVRSSKESKSVERASFDTSVALASAVGTASIAIAVLGTVASIMALVNEQRRELRLLRVLGLSRSDLCRTIAYEAVLVSAFGATLGSVLGLGLGATLVLLVDRSILGYAPILKPAFSAIFGIPVVVIVAATLAAIISTRLNVTLFAPGSLRTSE